MIRIAVTTTLKVKSGQGAVWFPAEIDLPSLEEVFNRLREDRLIFVQRLETGIREGERRILSRFPTIVGIEGVATIVPLSVVMSELSEK